MNLTITRKLMLGFGSVLLLMAVVAGIGVYSVFSLRHSAQQTTRIGDRLNSISVEIQMHNLEAQRKVKSYFSEKSKIGEESAYSTYMEEADFEVHEMRSLVTKAVQ